MADVASSAATAGTLKFKLSIDAIMPTPSLEILRVFEGAIDDVLVRKWIESGHRVHCVRSFR
jgi:hypothetical protein